jgi:hypothetical protein
MSIGLSKIKEIKINSKAIKNADKTSANINYDTENNILLKGFDDAEDGIKFIRKSSLKKDFASNNTSYNYTVSDYGSKNFNVVVSVGDAFALVPNSIKYNTCHPLIFRTIGKFMPSKNNIGAQEIISRYAPKTLCNIE